MSSEQVLCSEEEELSKVPKLRYSLDFETFRGSENFLLFLIQILFSPIASDLLGSCLLLVQADVPGTDLLSLV